MRQAETLPSGILIEGLSGAEGDPIWIQVTRQEARLQSSYRHKASEMRADLPLKHHEDHHGRHRPTPRSNNRGCDSKSNQVSPESLHNRVRKPDTAPRQGQGDRIGQEIRLTTTSYGSAIRPSLLDPRDRLTANSESQGTFGGISTRKTIS
jgi:hypothetical protein